MEKFQYREQNTTKSFVIITLYLTAWIVGASVYFGGFLQLADAVNDIGSAKAAGLLVGVLVVAPFIFLMRLVYTKVIVEMDHEKIVFQKGRGAAIIVNCSEIEKIIINAEAMNTLHLYDRNGALLYAILPIANTENLVETIPKMLEQKIRFKRQQTTRKFLNTQYIKSTFQRIS